MSGANARSAPKGVGGDGGGPAEKHAVELEERVTLLRELVTQLREYE